MAEPWEEENEEDGPWNDSEEDGPWNDSDLPGMEIEKPRTVTSGGLLPLGKITEPVGDVTEAIKENPGKASAGAVMGSLSGAPAFIPAVNRYYQENKNHPAYMAGEIFGTAASPLGKASVAGKGAGVAEKILRPAIVGATEGAIYSGATEGKPIEGGVIGGVGGATFGMAPELFEYLTKKAGAVGRGIKDFAADVAGPIFRDTKGGVKQERLRSPADPSKYNRDVGRYALDNKLLTPKAGPVPMPIGMSNAKGIYKRTEAQRKKVGEVFGSHIDEIDAIIPASVDLNRVADRLEAIAEDAKRRGNTSVENRMREKIEELRQAGKVSMQDAQDRREEFEVIIDLGGKNKTKKRAENAARAAFADEMGEVIDQAHKSGLTDKTGEGWQAINQEYALIRDMTNKVGGASDALKQNQAWSLTDKGFSGFGMLGSGALGYQATQSIPMAIGSAALGLGAGQISKQIRTRGRSTAARTLNRVGQAAQYAPESLGAFGVALASELRRNPGQFAIIHRQLYDNNPDYQQMVDSLSGEDQ
jgi:hypothetical protein